MFSLMAISPVDGRYAEQTGELNRYYSEFALFQYRVRVEVEYLYFLVHLDLPGLRRLKSIPKDRWDQIWKMFSLEDAQWIKQCEGITRHDVKAVEYFLKDKMSKDSVFALTPEESEYIHFGLTSQDINNTAIPLLMQESLEYVFFPWLDKVLEKITEMSIAWQAVPMMARTHGQPASPTTLGKEIRVFENRLKAEKDHLKTLRMPAKFGGATGNLNAHKVAFPQIDWLAEADRFVYETLGLKRSRVTTQIEHYDGLAALFHSLSRVNTILTDLCRDFWTYISMEYFTQKTVAGEIGSSAMPHKVNPIDFENAEGNLGLANALFLHFSQKLPVSRLQRDLTDSTVLRNVGVPFAHTLLALKSCLKGLDKVRLNETKVGEDLEANWAVLAEAIQTLLRREGYPKPYEALKELTRGNLSVTRETLHQFIQGLTISDAVKAEMMRLTPSDYTGYAETLAAGG
jgi:adenylosuccinate lyase